MEAATKAKKARRKQLASLSVEEKVKILVELQKMAAPILNSRGLNKTPWMTCHLFQVKDKGHVSPIKTTPIQIQTNLNSDWPDSVDSRTNSCFYNQLKD